MPIRPETVSPKFVWFGFLCAGSMTGLHAMVIGHIQSDIFTRLTSSKSMHSADDYSSADPCRLKNIIVLLFCCNDTERSCVFKIGITIVSSTE